MHQAGFVPVWGRRATEVRCVAASKMPGTSASRNCAAIDRQTWIWQNLVIGNTDGANFVDLSVALAPGKVDGKMIVRAHLKRELAERARLRLSTSHLDGKQEPLTWYYHAIPIADTLPAANAKNK